MEKHLGSAFNTLLALLQHHGRDADFQPKLNPVHGASLHGSSVNTWPA